jgi:dihydrofolate reductase
MKNSIKLIVAMDLDRGIGKNNDLMWHLPADMQFFKTTTQGQIVIMGRKNFDSIPERFRPLPNRENVILTRNTDFSAANCLVFHSLEESIKHFENEIERTVFIIGGGQIYGEALRLGIIDEMYITHVNHRFEAETFFPIIDESEWEITELLSYEADEKNVHSFVVKHYIRKNKA